MKKLIATYLTAGLVSLLHFSTTSFAQGLELDPYTDCVIKAELKTAERDQLVESKFEESSALCEDEGATAGKVEACLEKALSEKEEGLKNNKNLFYKMRFACLKYPWSN